MLINSVESGIKLHLVAFLQLMKDSGLEFAYLRWRQMQVLLPSFLCNLIFTEVIKKRICSELRLYR